MPKYEKRAGWWKGFPWRFVQTNLREIDMADIDAAEYVRQMQAFDATIAMINASGIIASYPTELTDIHMQSPYLTGDSLETIIAACHEADIRVFARCDFSKVRRALYESHPEWAFRTKVGEAVDYNGDVHVCILSDYQQQHAYRIVEETLTKLSFDGIFFNMSGFISQDYSYNRYGICHCAACREAFHAFCGQELPDTIDLDTEVGRQYRLFRRKVEKESNARMTAFIGARFPHVCINRGFAEDGFFRMESNTGFDRTPVWPYGASENTRVALTSYPNLRISNNTVDFIDFAVRHSTVSPYQQQLRVAQCLANGGEADYYMIGRLDNHADKTGYAPIQQMFRFYAEHEDIFNVRKRLVADVLLVRPEGDQAEYRGWYRTLTERHFLFAAIEQDALTARDLSTYRAVILPDCRILSDEQAQQLDDYVRGGGQLIASGLTGERDGEARMRQTPAPGCLGMTKTLAVRNDMRGAYAVYPEDMTARLNSELTYIDGTYRFAAYQSAAEAIGMLLPPQPFGPPERCYPLIEASTQPVFTRVAVGKGMAISIPWFVGTLYHRDGYQTSADCMADIIVHTLGIAPLETDLPAMVEINLFESLEGDGRRFLFVMNNSGCFHNTYFAPVRTAQATVRLPGEDALTVPPVDMLEVIVLS